MDTHEARLRLQEIQRIMERATLFTQLPGLAAVIGGLLVLGGCAVSYGLLGSVDFAQLLEVPFRWQVLFCFMWLAIGVAGIVLEVVLTARSARELGLSADVRSARVATFSLTPSIVVAVVLTIRFLGPFVEPTPEEIRYIVPVWMMLYGTGVYTAGLFSLRAPRVLGLTFLGLGVLALLGWPQYGVLWAVGSFGLLHILFGLYIMHRQRQERAR